MDLKSYEREGQETYAAFAEVVASILRQALKSVPQLRLQLITTRAKAIDSLGRKLSDRGLADSSRIEEEIKDLAGCRVVFYTNSDVNGFLRSRIVRDNFEIIDVKVHQPARKTDDEKELYISIHYLVALTASRSSLVEYARFAGLRCEIQVQTILNHSWAAMAHDTIYKSPELLSGFGSQQFNEMKRRLGRIMGRYLLPAGYEFDKIVSDFESLREARELFDADPLTQLAKASDNDERMQVLEALATIIPHYDDLPTAWPKVLDAIVDAAERSDDDATGNVATIVGAGRATAIDVKNAVIKILHRYRFLDIDRSLDAAFALFDVANDETVIKAVLDFGAALAKHELRIWKMSGHAIQSHLVDRIAALPTEQLEKRLSLIAIILKACLGPELQGTSSNSTSVTWRRGPIPVSATLKAMRRKAIDLLAAQYEHSTGDQDRRELMAALNEATRTPHGSDYSNEFEQMIAGDTSAVIDVILDTAPCVSLLHRQELENSVYRFFKTYSSLPASMASDESIIGLANEIVEKSIRLRDLLNDDRDFVIFKTLVGFQAVFPPAWHDPGFDFRQAKVYREEAVERLLAEVGPETADEWFRILTFCAEAKSNDGAMFPTLQLFISRLAQARPEIARDFIDRMGRDLAGFLPAFLCGLINASDPVSINMIDRWIGEGKNLRDIVIALAATDELPDESLVARATEAAIRLKDLDAALAALKSAGRLLERSPDRYLHTSFYPALELLLARGDQRWLHLNWHSWLDSRAIEAMDLDMAKRTLEGMLPVPYLRDDAEYVVGGLAKRWPEAVLEFLGRRQQFADDPESERPSDYEALPHSLYALGPELRKHVRETVHAARGWFDLDQGMFPYRGGHFVAEVFRGHEVELEGVLRDKYLASEDRQDTEFVVALLLSMEGPNTSPDMVRATVARIPEGDPLLADLRIALEASGVVSGEYGFVEHYEQRLAVVEPWLEDENENVREFARQFIRSIKNDIAQEQGRARASVAQRRLDYDEPIDDLLSLSGGDEDEGPQEAT